MYDVIDKVSGWATWVELQKEVRPQLTFAQIKLKGSVKWAELHKGNTSDMFAATKTEKASMATTGKGGHVPKNCRDTNCHLDH